jgi:hypothetical protein
MWRTVGLWLLLTVSAPAESPWFLENRNYFDPLMADPRAAQIQILFPALADSPPFAQNPGRGLVWDISVGHEFPILGWASRGDADDLGVQPGAIGVGLWFPISFHMIEDLNRDASAPILDTDYRFSGQLKLQYGLSSGWAKAHRAHVGLRFQAGHESTHIGDEFSIEAIEKYPNSFIRVNVSYQYYDLAAAFEPNFGRLNQHRLKLRGGAIWLWQPDQGWWSETAVLYPLGEIIARSRRNYEPYVGAEFLYRLRDKNGGSGPYGIITSVDIRDRTIYQYQTAPLTHDEPTEISVNSMIGFRQDRTTKGRFGKISPTYYLRYYHGVNPNGQFRSQSHFTEFGFGVLLGF